MKLSVVKRQQTVQRWLARDSARHRMDDHTRLDVDLSLHLARPNFKHARTASKTLDLNDVDQTHLPQRAGKPFALSPGDQIIQQIEHRAHSIACDRFFEKKFRSGRQAM